MSHYPDKPIHDVAGHVGIPGRELVKSLQAQADRFETSYLLNCRVESFERSGAGFHLGFSDGQWLSARSVLLAVGIGTATPRRLPMSAEWEGRGLSYTVLDVADFADRDVVIVGGGDSALDWALTLEPVARSVTLVHRRAHFRSHAASVRAVRDSSAEVLTESEVVAVYGRATIAVVVLDHTTGERRERAASRIVAALGFVSNLGPLKEWPLGLAGRRRVVVDSRMRTSVEGIFAAGDATEYHGKVRLMCVGFGEAATAINNIAVMLNPAASLFPGHSTDVVSQPA